MARQARQGTSWYRRQRVSLAEADGSRSSPAGVLAHEENPSDPSIARAVKTRPARNSYGGFSLLLQAATSSFQCLEIF